MTIIFSTDDEVETFINELDGKCCPSEINLTDHPDCRQQYEELFCIECWRQSGIFEKKRVEV